MSIFSTMTKIEHHRHHHGAFVPSPSSSCWYVDDLAIANQPQRLGARHIIPLSTHSFHSLTSNWCMCLAYPSGTKKAEVGLLASHPAPHGMFSMPITPSTAKVFQILTSRHDKYSDGRHKRRAKYLPHLFR